MDDVKEIIVDVFFIISGGAILIALFMAIGRIHTGIDEKGIEADGVVSRIDESVDRETGAVQRLVFARYRTKNGKEVQGILWNAPKSLQKGQNIRLKYHPTFRTNAKVLGMESEEENLKIDIL